MLSIWIKTNLVNFKLKFKQIIIIIIQRLGNSTSSAVVQMCWLYKTIDKSIYIILLNGSSEYVSQFINLKTRILLYYVRLNKNIFSTFTNSIAYFLFFIQAEQIWTPTSN